MVYLNQVEKMNLYDLTKLILTVYGRPISKIRLSKTIYFLHKELIKLQVMKPGDILYLRKPLGPTPKDFKTLVSSNNDIALSENESELSYNQENYTLKSSISKTKNLNNPLFKKVDSILDGLSRISTARLVELSQKELAWINHINGEEFIINIDDLDKNDFLSLNKPWNDDLSNLMQTNLLRGMLDDIIRESTDLEYPDEK